jgi:hypothetical protein
MIIRVMPDMTLRFFDDANWYDDFGEYLHSDEQARFEEELWREAGRKPDAVLTITSGGKTEEIEIYHPLK